jgi:hypothetical protein
MGPWRPKTSTKKGIRGWCFGFLSFSFPYFPYSLLLTTIYIVWSLQVPTFVAVKSRVILHDEKGHGCALTDVHNRSPGKTTQSLLQKACAGTKFCVLVVPIGIFVTSQQPLSKSDT